jgi:hypothetical protein
MKTSKKINALNGKNRIVVFISIAALLILICSITFHITPFKMYGLLSEFAVHHYFLSGFFALAVFSICLKNYFTNQEEIDDLKNEKNLLFKNKIKQRKQRIQKFKNNIALKILSFKNRVNKKNVRVNAKYSLNDVLLSQEEVELRQHNLSHAMKLGVSFKQNVKLYYKESNLHKCIETAILFVNSEHVTIRGGIVLPVRSIYKVEI